MSELFALLARFVVAIETIAAHMSGATATDPEENGTGKKEPGKTTTRGKAAPKDEDEGEEEDEPKATNKRTTTRKTPAKTPAKGKAPAKDDNEDADADLEEMRDEIGQMAKHIGKGDSDECADKFDALLEDYGIRNVTKLSDDDVEEFHGKIKKLTAKYYDID